MSYYFPTNEGQFIIERKKYEECKQLPAYVTKNNTPMLYKAIFNDPVTSFINNDPFVYDLSVLPNDFTRYRDPGKIEPNKIYGQIYENNNGVKVLIQGEYDSVMSTLAVLKAYPPARIPQGVEYEYDLLDDSGITNTIRYDSSVPKVAYTVAKDNIIILADKKKYSGSGVLIIAIDDVDPISKSKAKIILVNSNESDMYEEFGGKIDKTVEVNSETLFNNARKETQEESMMLFDVTTKSMYSVDIESQVTGTYYKIFVYLIKIKNLSTLPQLYEANKVQVYNVNKDKAFKETNSLRLFNYSDFINKMNDLGSSANIISKSSFKNTYNDFVNVRSRTIKTMYQLINSSDKILDKLFGQTSVPIVQPVFNDNYNIFNL